jgi:tetratricopeptide (TPR) repeat protein
VAASVLGIELRTALEHLSRDLKQRHGLVQEAGDIATGPLHLNRFQFRHGLFQEYLYGQLSQGEKSLLHRTVAQGLEKAVFGKEVEPADGLAAEAGSVGGLEAFGPALVNHFWLGEAWGKAATYALQMGQLARSRFAMREAIAYYERALGGLGRLPDAPYPLVCETLLHWEDAAFNFRTYEEQLKHLARAERLAREHQDAPRLIQALHWTANVFLARGLWTQAGPALSECLTLAEASGDERLSVRPVYFKGLMTSFADPPSALTWLNRALGLAQSHHDQHIEAVALGTKAQVQAQLGEFVQSQEAIQGARQVVGQLDSPLTESDVDLLAAWAYLAMGDAQQGLELGQRSVEVAIATDNMDCLCSGLACVGYGNLELKRIPEAIAAFREGIERSAISGAVIPKLNGQAGLVMARFFAGDTGAVEEMEGVLTDMRLYQFFVGEANANQMLGACLFQLGALDRAEDHLSRAVDYYRRSEMRPYLAKALSILAAVMEKQGRPADAESCLAEAAALRQAFTPPSTTATAGGASTAT